MTPPVHPSADSKRTSDAPKDNKTIRYRFFSGFPMSLLSSLLHARRTVVLASSTAMLSAALTPVAVSPASAAVPKTPKFGASIENLSPYQPQTKCTSQAHPGVGDVRAPISQ